MEIEIDKLSENFSIRVPEILKIHLDKLSPPQKKVLNKALLIAMAKHIHESQFNPMLYLTSGE